MKKLRIGVLVLLTSLFLTGCGCSKKEKFIVTFDSNGGTVVEAQMVEEGDVVTRPDDPTREGYDFEGWYLDLDDEDEYDFDTKVVKNIILEAKWSDATSGKENKEPEKACKLTCEEGYKLVNGDSKDCKCEKINVEVTGVSLSTYQVTLVVGGNTTVYATVNPSNANNKTVTWKTNNASVATVSNGTIYAVGEGTATITAVASGKTASVTVTVITQDQANLNGALNTIAPKNITNGNTNINYSYNGCTITNTANTVSAGNNGMTTVSGGVVTKLYRTLGNGSISSTYNVVCGSKSQSKTINHSIPASTYSYTSNYNGLLYVVSVNGATNYTLSSANASNLRYVAAAGGAQTPAHVVGAEYSMVLDSDLSTIYAVRSAE